MYALETNNLTKKFKDKVVVNNINLNVPKGSIYGFLGKNGAGKSTFINMVTGISIPTSGNIKLNSTLSKVGVLPDYSSFYDNLNAEEHLKYFSNILGHKITNEEIKTILINVGLDISNKTKVKNYSFGMKKKLGIAQTLINNPDIIFLDEPTSGVDPNSILTIHNLIRKLSKDGKTIFLTSHNLDEVEKLCDTIAIMDKGNILIEGSLKDIKRNYQNVIEVTYKIKCENIDIKYLINNRMSKYSTNIRYNKDQIILDTTNYDTIAEINELLVNHQVKVFGINVYEPTLEEIFINTGSK
ncbi:ABC transporter ATP-binding protein [Macrococcus equi]|uniref:ABC transporter ATP-binding protein n=1 Tax=Macrococcus equi TaxID=3395462 RepID=UPI0039BDFF42